MGRSPCCEKAHTNKGAWTKEEDDRLIAYIRAHGEGCWRSLPKAAGLLRCGKSCRLRWINYLRPDLKRGNFTEEEDELIIKLHNHLGNKWSLIAGRLPGRTDNEIKNYWNTHIKRKLLSRGIDPITHHPISGGVAGEPPAAAAQQDQVKTISFSGAATSTATTTTTTTAGANNSNNEVNGKTINSPKKEEKIPVGERCPDLNLELRISPPYQYQYQHQQQQQQLLKSGVGRSSSASPTRGSSSVSLCFTCSLGIQNSKDCSCDTIGGSSTSSDGGYDFLGL
ncbi:hypothetical protein ACH5RR_002448 [Cinchona calisaya]|uniref:Uncharacterized protein n=1 Tax=Cinchona calisaya TaxID=153742 RepID=A0ABD3B7K0_9GENT